METKVAAGIVAAKAFHFLRENRRGKRKRELSSARNGFR
jgi:hypothetical protein